MKKYGLVNRDGAIENVIELSDVDNYTPPEGLHLIFHDDVEIGRQVKDGVPVVEALEIEPLDYSQLRQSEYPAIGNQLDAIWKQLNYDRMQGRPLIQEVDDLLNEVLAVKAKYPKPTLKEEN